MTKIYMVLINCGFNGVMYFHNLENAERFAKQIGEKVETETATPHEYVSILFSDF